MQENTSRVSEKWLNILEKCVSPDGKWQKSCALFEWPETKPNEDGVMQFPYVSYSDEMFDFWEYLAALGYAAPFDYVEWQTEFFKQHSPVENLEWLEQCNKDTLNKFMFCLRRGHKFYEALWEKWISEGKLLRLYKKVLEIEGL